MATRLVHTWTSPHGFQYEVGPYGTTALGRPQPRDPYDDDNEYARREDNHDADRDHSDHEDQQRQEDHEDQH